MKIEESASKLFVQNIYYMTSNLCSMFMAEPLFAILHTFSFVSVNNQTNTHNRYM